MDRQRGRTYPNCMGLEGPIWSHCDTLVSAFQYVADLLLQCRSCRSSVIYSAGRRLSSSVQRSNMACPWKPVRRQYSVPPLHIEFDTEPLLSYPPPPLNMVFAPEYEIVSPTFDPGVQPITSVAAKIPKPSGEVGRPGRGGYKLIDALGWDAKQYESIVVWAIHFSTLTFALTFFRRRWQT